MATYSLFGVLILFFLSLTTTWAAKSLYACPGRKGIMGKGVECEVVQLPPDLCSACPMKAPEADGQFKQCSNIHETSTATCQASMNSYVEANPCDIKRKAAMDAISAGNPSANDLLVVDFFVYSICHQCCDCIPMGASEADSGEWSTSRGACPANAWFNICALLPKVVWFVKIGESTTGHGNKRMCHQLHAWSKSKFFDGWQDNNKTTLKSSTHKALASVLTATSCSASTWTKCFDLEKKQGNLGKEGSGSSPVEGPLNPEGEKTQKGPLTRGPKPSNPETGPASQPTETPSEVKQPRNPGTAPASPPSEQPPSNTEQRQENLERENISAPASKPMVEKTPPSTPGSNSSGPTTSQDPRTPLENVARKNTGTIIAAVLVPSTVMLGLCLALFFWRRRRKNGTSINGVTPSKLEDPSEFPFSRDSTDNLGGFQY